MAGERLVGRLHAGVGGPQRVRRLLDRLAVLADDVLEALLAEIIADGDGVIIADRLLGERVVDLLLRGRDEQDDDERVGDEHRDDRAGRPIRPGSRPVPAIGRRCIRGHSASPPLKPEARAYVGYEGLSAGLWRGPRRSFRDPILASLFTRPAAAPARAAAGAASAAA